MGGHRLVWLMSLGLMTAGGIVAHVAAYRLVAPGSHAHHQTAGGGGSGHLKLCLALCATIVVVGVAASLLARTRARRTLAPPLWLFALFPPVGFAVQEHLERLLHTGTIPYGTGLEPVFLVGVALQLPFAVAAYLVARAVIRLAVAVVAELRGRHRPRLVSLSLSVPVSVRRPGPRELVLAGGLGARSPPAPAVG